MAYDLPELKVFNLKLKYYKPNFFFGKKFDYH